MEDPLPIRPFTAPVSGEICPPGSKSITNRALILATLCHQPVTLEGALFSRDTRLMCEALFALGLKVETDAALARIRIEGHAGQFPVREAGLTVGNAGTVARFLTPLVCLQPEGRYRLEGDEAMRRRPMQGLLEALEQLGARFTFEEEPGYFPFIVETHGLTAPETPLTLDASASSQLLSGLLMVAPLANRGLRIGLRGPTVSKPFVQMTIRMMEQFGMRVKEAEGLYSFAADTHYRLGSDAYWIEPDATAASYFMVLPFVAGGSLTIPGLAKSDLQGDWAFTRHLAALGLEQDTAGGALSIRRVRPASGPIKADFNAISDTFLTLAALSPLLPGPVCMNGIAHTRHQETDRVEAMATELRRLGQRVETGEDHIAIIPDAGALRRTAGEGVTIETYDDHRMAMSFGILGCADLRGDGRPWLSIANPATCGKTYPGFFDVLEGIRPAPPADAS